MANSIPSAFSDNNFLSDEQMQKLAHELARDLRTPEEVLTDFGISMEDFQTRIRPSDTFTQYYAESFALWHGVSNLPERVKTKCAMAFEEFLPEAVRIMHDNSGNLPPRVQLAMFLGKLGGLEPMPGASSAPGAAVNNKVHVTINLGHGRQVVIEKQLNPTIEGESVDVTHEVQHTPAVSYTGTPTEAPKPEGEMRPKGFPMTHTPMSANIEFPPEPEVELPKNPAVKIRPSSVRYK